MILNHTYRLYPDNQQAQLLDEWLETLRVSYNYALREIKDWIASRKCPMDRCSLEFEYIMSADYPFPSYHQQQNNLPKAKKEFPRLKSVPSQVLQTKKVLQRRLAKKKKRSKNYEKARKKVEKQHNHIALQRKDYQYCKVSIRI
jgi:transposase